MTTPARHALLQMREVDDGGTDDGRAFPTAGRERWTVKIVVPVLEGTSVDVAVKASGLGRSEDDFVTLHTETVTTTGVTLIGYDEDTSLSESVTEEHNWIMASATANGGDAIVEAVGWAPFFRGAGSPNDLGLLPKEVATFDERAKGRGTLRLVEEAEADVLELMGMNALGIFTNSRRLNDPLSLPRIRQAIAAQTVHLYQKERLERSREPSAIVSVRKYPRYGDSVGRHLDPVLGSRGSGVWLGRG